MPRMRRIAPRGDKAPLPASGFLVTGPGKPMRPEVVTPPLIERGGPLGSSLLAQHLAQDSRRLKQAMRCGTTKSE